MLISPPPWRGFLYIPFSQTFPEEIRDCLSFREEEVKFSPQGMPFEKIPYHLIGVDIPARPSLGNAMRKNSR